MHSLRKKGVEDIGGRVRHCERRKPDRCDLFRCAYFVVELQETVRIRASKRCRNRSE